MKRRGFLPLLAATTMAWACGGGASDEETSAQSDAAMDAQEMGEMAAMDDAALSCFVRGDTEGRASPLQRVSFEYEGGEGLLCYGSPSVRDREIFGALVPYDAPWRLGANEATGLHLSAPATVGGVRLEAGSYSVYAIPQEGMDWEFVFNGVHDRWGIPIDEGVQMNHVGSFTMAPTPTDAMVESLTFEFMDGALRMSWADVRFDVSVEGA